MEDTAHHDSVRAAELTAPLKAGDIAVADWAYDVLQGARADLPNPRLHWVQRERRAVVDVDRAPRPSPAPLSALPVEVGAELSASRGTRARHPLELTQAHRDAAAVWDGKLRGISLLKVETSGFPVRLRLHACWNGTSDIRGATCEPASKENLL